LGEREQKRETKRGRENRKREAVAIPCSRTGPHGRVVEPGGIRPAVSAVVGRRWCRGEGRRREWVMVRVVRVVVFDYSGWW